MYEGKALWDTEPENEASGEMELKVVTVALPFGDPEKETEPELDKIPELLACTLPVPLLLDVEDSEAETAAEADTDSDVELLPLKLPEPVGDRDANEPVLDSLGEAEKVLCSEPVALRDGDGEKEKKERVPDDEEERLCEVQALVLGLSDALGEGDPDAESELLPEKLGLSEGVSLALALRVSLTEPEGAAVVEGLPVPQLTALFDARSASEPDEVGEELRDREPVVVPRTVADTLLLRVGPPDADGVGREESEGEKLGEPLFEEQSDTLGLKDELALWEALGLALSLPLVETEAEGLCEVLALTT